MQNSLREIIAYILRFYFNKEELSKYRLTKLVYLCDWCYAVSRGKQITNIHWFFDNYGPFVWDVIDIAKQENQLFNVHNAENFYGQNITLIKLHQCFYNPVLSSDVKECIEYVLENTKNLDLEEFTNLVYATYPIKTSRRYTNLDLVQKAKEYNKLRNYAKSN